MKMFLSLATAASLALSGVSIAHAQHYTQVSLVANTSGVAPVTDPNLVNPWGVSRTSSSLWWISDNGTGLSTLYNGAGAINPLVVTIPKADPANKTFPTGTPTGTIANASATDFLLAAGAPADFLFSTIDGTSSRWNPTVGIASGAAAPSTQAMLEVKTPDGVLFPTRLRVNCGACRATLTMEARNPGDWVPIASGFRHWSARSSMFFIWRMNSSLESL